MRNLLLCGLLSVFLAMNAEAAPSFEADVSVDVTAETVNDAKKEAMAKAARDGLNEVVLSISTAKSAAQFDSLSDTQIQHFISGVMVLMEKSSDVRYIADLRVSINEEVLKAYMAENEMPLVVGEEQDVLVIPLWEETDGSLNLWGDENIWRLAFVERGRLKKGNLNIYCIEKNLGNIAAAVAESVYDMSNGNYANLADFNRVQAVYVLKYSLKDGKVYVKAFPEQEVEEVEIGDNSPLSMIDKVLPFFKDRQKIDDAVADHNIDERFEVIYTYPKLGAWLALKRLLDENPQVTNVNVASIANGKVHFNFEYSGVAEKLMAHLEINGYKLRREGDHYVIY